MSVNSDDAQTARAEPLGGLEEFRQWERRYDRGIPPRLGLARGDAFSSADLQGHGAARLQGLRRESARAWLAIRKASRDIAATDAKMSKRDVLIRLFLIWRRHRARLAALHSDLAARHAEPNRDAKHRP